MISFMLFSLLNYQKFNCVDLISGIEMKPQKIAKWAENKNPIIAIIAQQCASGADACFDFFSSIKAGERYLGDRPLPPIKKWLSLYRSNRRLQDYFITRFRSLGGFYEILAESISALLFQRRYRLKIGTDAFIKEVRQEIENLSIDDRLELVEAFQKSFQEAYLISLDDTESHISGSVDEPLKQQVLSAIKEPEALFLAGVVFPCWILYQVHPAKLFRQARLGNINAMDKLLRIDKAVLHDPKIGEHFYKIANQKKRSQFDRLTQAIQKGPEGKITLQKIKMLIAGFISKASQALGRRLSAPEIRSLFDAIAQDAGRGDIDTDIPDSPEAFAKAIRRERSFWKIIPVPGQK